MKKYRRCVRQEGKKTTQGKTVGAPIRSTEPERRRYGSITRKKTRLDERRYETAGGKRPRGTGYKDI